jgi:hypothetical protein
VKFGLNAVAQSLFRMLPTIDAFADKLSSIFTEESSPIASVQSLRGEFHQWKGSVTESMVRGVLSTKFGYSWAASRHFQSLDEVINWVGQGIRASELQIKRAKNAMVEYFTHGFQGFGQGQAMVCLPGLYQN